jgi:hypothetical protein
MFEGLRASLPPASGGLRREDREALLWANIPGLNTDAKAWRTRWVMDAAFGAGLPMQWDEFRRVCGEQKDAALDALAVLVAALTSLEQAMHEAESEQVP